DGHEHTRLDRVTRRVSRCVEQRVRPSRTAGVPFGAQQEIRVRRAEIGAPDVPTVFPSPPPGASSGSLLPAETSATEGAGSQRSLTCQPTLIGTRVWFGGQRRPGSLDTDSAGGVVSATVITRSSRSSFPALSVTWRVT